MTFELLQETIKQLIIKRQKAHGNDLEQKRINEKLTKLYNIKYIMLEQRARGN